MKKLLKISLVLFCILTSQTNIFCMLRGSGQLAMRAAMTRAATPQTKNQVAKFALMSSQSHDNPWDLGMPEVRSAQQAKDTDKKEKEKIEKLQAIAKMHAELGKLNEDISEKRKDAASLWIAGPVMAGGALVIGKAVFTVADQFPDHMPIIGKIPLLMELGGIVLVGAGSITMPIGFLMAFGACCSRISNLKQKKINLENQIVRAGSTR